MNLKTRKENMQRYINNERKALSELKLIEAHVEIVEAEMEKEFVPPTNIGGFYNNTFITHYCYCDTCFGVFDEGNQEIQFCSDDGNICVTCVEEFAPGLMEKLTKEKS